LPSIHEVWPIAGNGLPGERTASRVALCLVQSTCALAGQLTGTARHKLSRRSAAPYLVHDVTYQQLIECSVLLSRALADDLLIDPFVPVGLVEVSSELASELRRAHVVGCFVLPGVSRVEDLRSDIRTGTRNQNVK